MNSEAFSHLVDVEALYQNAPCGYISFSSDSTILKINRTLLNWIGYDEKELVGKKFTTLLPKGGQMHFEMFFQPMVNVNKQVNEISYEIIRKDNSALPVLMSATTVTGGNIKLTVINAVLIDISERRVYEKELLLAKRTAESEKKRLQFMADLVPEIIWTASAKGFIDYVNARFCQYFNCDGTDTRLSFIISKVHSSDCRELLLQWFTSLATGKDLNRQVRLINQQGNYEWHLLKAAKFLDSEGNLTNWFGSCTNIDDHVNALQKKDEFVSIASHELKTPITSLKAILQLMERLKNDHSNKMLPALIEKASRNIVKVNSLVDDLLNASQFNDGQLTLNKTTVNLVNLISDCVHHIGLEGKYEIIIIGDTHLEAELDETRIEQVLVNFVNNAIKYAPDSKQITITIVSQPGFVRIEVSDQGPGIPSEKLPFLFDRYYQVKGNFGKYSGLGLGLYICSEIIKKHGGEIGATSCLGKGSTFWFSLPD